MVNRRDPGLCFSRRSVLEHSEMARSAEIGRPGVDRMRMPSTSDWGNHGSLRRMDRQFTMKFGLFLYDFHGKLPKC